MSNQVYFILRNNKEKGPYSLEELLQFSLKQHDLIWVEGGSSWRSPSEIEALKPYLNLPENNPQKTVLDSGQIFFSYPKNIPLEITNTRPGPKMSTGNSPAPFDNEDELTAESLEIKAAKIYQRVLAYNAQKLSHDEGVVAEGAHTLQELKEEYASWHRKKEKKEKNAKNRKKLLMRTGIAVIAALGFFIAMQSTGIKKKTHATPELYITNTVAPVTTKASMNVNPEATNKKQNSITDIIEKDAVLPVPVIQPRELSVDEFIDSIRQVMSKHDRLNSLRRVKKSYKK